MCFEAMQEVRVIAWQKIVVQMVVRLPADVCVLKKCEKELDYYRGKIIEIAVDD
jgi:hypothetical protein